MNPLDRQELQPFLRNLKEEMPIHTHNTAKIKRSYSQGMPKNLMDYSAFVNNHFLNDNLAIIEEMQHRNKQHPIPKWFRDYQIRHYAKYGILKGDHFFGPFAKIFPDLGEHRGIGFLPYAGMTLGFGTIGDTKVFGSTLETFASPTSTDSMGPDRLFAFILPNSAVVGTYYDQIAASITVAAGAWRGGVYDDSATSPNNLLGSDTGAITAVANYANHLLTEFVVTTTQLWCAMINNDGGLTMEINGSITNGLKYRDVAYGALPGSWGSVTGTSSNSRRLKISHS